MAERKVTTYILLPRSHVGKLGEWGGIRKAEVVNSSQKVPSDHHPSHMAVVGFEPPREGSVKLKKYTSQKVPSVKYTGLKLSMRAAASSSIVGKRWLLLRAATKLDFFKPK